MLRNSHVNGQKAPSNLTCNVGERYLDLSISSSLYILRVHNSYIIVYLLCITEILKKPSTYPWEKLCITTSSMWRWIKMFEKVNQLCYGHWRLFPWRNSALFMFIFPSRWTLLVSLLDWLSTFDCVLFCIWTYRQKKEKNIKCSHIYILDRKHMYQASCVRIYKKYMLLANTILVTLISHETINILTLKIRIIEHKQILVWTLDLAPKQVKVLGLYGYCTPFVVKSHIMFGIALPNYSFSSYQVVSKQF